MKKFLLLFSFFLISLSIFSQTQGLSNVNPADKSGLLSKGETISKIPKCFCCDNAYQLPVPPITGPKSVKCGDTARFQTSDCPGAKISWSVNPTANFQSSGNGIIIYPSLTPGVYTVTVTISCGNQSNKNSFQFKVDKPTSCNPGFTFTYTLLANGYININTVPDASTQVPGNEHWWGIQYNGSHPNCNKCEAIPYDQFNNTKVWGGYINPAGVLTPYMGSGLTKGTSGYGINYSGFPNNSCVRITHYIKCCGELYRQTQCVSFTTVNNKLAKPEITISQTEYVGHVTLLK